MDISAYISLGATQSFDPGTSQTKEYIHEANFRQVSNNEQPLTDSCLPGKKIIGQSWEYVSCQQLLRDSSLIDC